MLKSSYEHIVIKEPRISFNFDIDGNYIKTHAKPNVKKLNSINDNTIWSVIEKIDIDQITNLEKILHAKINVNTNDINPSKYTNRSYNYTSKSK